MNSSMELTCYEVESGRVELRPGVANRTWMDRTPNAFAYRCLPLVSANQHGWDMLCPFDFEVSWNGGPELADLTIRMSDEAAGQRPGFVASHFGSGILTFNPLLIIRTAADHNLWVTGPVNSFKDGAQPMSATIETDWMPFTFSMNWKITRADTPIRFGEGEPFCRFFPIPRGLVGRCQPRLAALADEPALRESYEWGKARRQLDSALAGSTRDMWQSWYRKGEMPNRAAGSAPPNHEVTIDARPFARRKDDD